MACLGTYCRKENWLTIFSVLGTRVSSISNDKNRRAVVFSIDSYIHFSSHFPKRNIKIKSKRCSEIKVEWKFWIHGELTVLTVQRIYWPVCERYQFQNNTLSPVIFSSARYPKRHRKSSRWCGSTTTFLTPQRCDGQPSSFIYGNNPGRKKRRFLWPRFINWVIIVTRLTMVLQSTTPVIILQKLPLSCPTNSPSTTCHKSQT